MKAGGRYWLMVAVLLGATAGLAHLSHGESTPPAKPLSEFPKKIGPWGMITEWPLDKETIDLLRVTDYLNRGYWEPGMKKNMLGLYIGYFRSQRTGATIHSPKNCLPGRGLEPYPSVHLPVAAGRRPQSSHQSLPDPQGSGVRGGAVLVPVAWPHHGQRILGQILFSV